MGRAPRSGEPGASRIPEAAGSVSCGNGGIPISQPSRSPTRMRASPGPCWQTTKPTIPAWRLDRPEDAGTSRQRSQGGPTKPLQRSAEMVKAVTPSLPEPGVWTGMASANVLAPLRWKRAKSHRGSRHRHMPHQEAGYTSAAVALDPNMPNTVAIGRGPYTSTHGTKETLGEPRDLSQTARLCGTRCDRHREESQTQGGQESLYPPGHRLIVSPEASGRGWRR